MIVIPELIIKAVVDGIVTMIHRDIEASPVKEDTLLYGIFEKLKYNSFVYYDQAVALFTINKGKSRQLKTKLSFDGDVSSPPIIYVTSGSDEFASAGIGRIESESVETKDKKVRSINSCRFAGKTSIVLISDNQEEVLVMYHTMRAMLLATIDTLSTSGIEDCRLGGGDVSLNEEMTPKGMFIKAISMTYQYEVRVPSAVYTKSGIKMEFGGIIATPIPDNDFGTNSIITNINT